MNLLDIFEGREPHQQAIDRLEQARIDHLKEKMDYYAKHGMLKDFQKAKQEHDSYHRVQAETMGYGTLVGEDTEEDEDDLRGRIENSTYDLVGYLKDIIDGNIPSADNILDSMNDAYGYDSDASEAELAKDKVATVVRNVMSNVHEALDSGNEDLSRFMPMVKKAYQFATANGYGQNNINEGSMKDAMWHDAERMNRNQFCSKWGQEHGEFWDNIMGGLDEATSGTNDKVLRKKYGNAINKYFSQIYNYGDDGLEHLDNSAPNWGIMFDHFDGDIDTLIAQTDIAVLPACVKELKDVLDDLKIGMVEAGIGQDIVNRTEKMARATPSTPTGKVASTVKNAAKWLAGKGGPGKEGPTYEGQAQKKNSEDPKLARLKTHARRENPQVATDDEALALHILDKEQSDVDQLHRENDREDRIIEKLVDLEKKLQQQIDQLSQQTLDEGWQDFNKVEPYAVCLAGKPVKKFDYYEEARRFHDNWKQKLYREGNQAKADKITLLPLGLDETALNPHDPVGDYQAKRKVLQDLELKRQADPTEIQKRRLELDKEARKHNIHETPTDYQKPRAQQKKDMELGEAGGGWALDPKTRLELQKRKNRQKTIAKYAGRDLEAEKRAKEHEYNNRVNTSNISEEQDTTGVEQAILHRIMVAHTDLLKQFGPQKVMQAAEEVAYNVGDVDEIGTSDVSAYVAQVKQILGAE